MKKIFLMLMMVILIFPSLADNGKKKKKKDTHNTEQVAHVTPIKRERWVERDGDVYVIVSRTTITKDDYLRIKNSSK